MMLFCCYDISSCKIRRKVAKYMERTATRIQDSAFLLKGGKEECDMITDFVRNMIKEKDSFMMIPIHEGSALYFGNNPFGIFRSCVII